MPSLVEKEAYIEGRLLGLSELVKLLNEMVSSDGQMEKELIKTLVVHIATEMEQIVQEIRGVQETREEIAPLKEKMDSVLKKLREKTKEMKKKAGEASPETFGENVKSADELMKDLMKLKPKEKE